MGTNFYWIITDHHTPTGEEVGKDEALDSLAPWYHVGKRAAAGFYCYDCRVPLVEGGERNVHTAARRYDTCPRCGKAAEKSGYNAAMVELGFEKAAATKLTGVQGASSFSFAQDPDVVIGVCNAHLWEPVIEDEYGKRYTGQEFLWMLDVGCPIRFTHSLGKWFC